MTTTSIHIPQEVEQWPIERPREYDRNSRTHSAAQVRRIVASMMEFGFTSPLLVDAEGVLVAGHGRLAAAKKLGLKEVPVIVLGHLSPEQRRAYVIADNQLAMQAGWDEEMLAAELDELQVDGFDLSLLGFDADELSKLLGGEFEGAEEEPEEEDGPLDRGIALAIVLSPQELMAWRRAKAELGYSTDKAAFWKMVENLLEEVE